MKTKENQRVPQVHYHRGGGNPQQQPCSSPCSSPAAGASASAPAAAPRVAQAPQDHHHRGGEGDNSHHRRDHHTPQAQSAQHQEFAQLSAPPSIS